MIPLTKDKKMLGYELLASYPGISCFVTTRHGGCSQGNYASFNCTPYTGDEAEAVRRNQEIVCSSLPQPQELVIPFQTHGTKALVINGTYLHATAEERHSMLQGIDALITRDTALLHLHLYGRLHSHPALRPEECRCRRPRRLAGNGSPHSCAYSPPDARNLRYGRERRHSLHRTGHLPFRLRGRRRSL